MVAIGEPEGIVEHAVSEQCAFGGDLSTAERKCIAIRKEDRHCRRSRRSWAGGGGTPLTLQHCQPAVRQLLVGVLGRDPACRLYHRSPSFPAA